MTQMRAGGRPKGRVERLEEALLNFAPFVLMLYLYFFQDWMIELKLTAVFLTCSYYFARVIYLSKHPRQAGESKIRLILPVLIFMGSFGLLSCISVRTQISYDEAVYIVAGDRALYYPFQEGRSNFEHPTLGKVIIGFPLMATGRLLDEPVWHGWNPEAWQTSIPRDVLLFARLAPTALTSLTCMFLYVIASKRSLLGGVLVSSLFLFNPLVLGNGFRAILDPILTFFMTLTWATLLEDNKYTGLAKASILYGLGFATKYTAVVMFPAFLSYAILGAREERRIKLLMGVLTFPLSAYVFGCIFSPFGFGDLGSLQGLEGLDLGGRPGGWLSYAKSFYLGGGRFFSLDSLRGEFAWTMDVVFLESEATRGSSQGPFFGVDYIYFLKLSETALFILALLYLIMYRWRRIVEPELSSWVIFTISLFSFSLFAGKNAYYMILLAPWYAHLISPPLESAAQRLRQLVKRRSDLRT